MINKYGVKRTPFNTFISNKVIVDLNFFSPLVKCKASNKDSCLVIILPRHKCKSCNTKVLYRRLAYHFMNSSNYSLVLSFCTKIIAFILKIRDNLLFPKMSMTKLPLYLCNIL